MELSIVSRCYGASQAGRVYLYIASMIATACLTSTRVACGNGINVREEYFTRAPEDVIEEPPPARNGSQTEGTGFWTT